MILEKAFAETTTTLDEIEWSYKLLNYLNFQESWFQTLIMHNFP